MKGIFISIQAYSNINVVLKRGSSRNILITKSKGTII